MTRRASVTRYLLGAAFLGALAYAQFRESGLPELAAHLEITVVRGDTGAVVPARLYLFKGDRPFRFSPVDGFLPLVPDTFYRERVWRQKQRPEKLEVAYKGDSHLILLDGRGTFDLPAASYRVEAYRGMFFEPAKEAFELKAGQTHKLTLKMNPLGGGGQQQWLSGDDHIHLVRAPEDDEVFLRWLQAEDLNVGNFLQLQRQMDAAPQYAFGRKGEAKLPGFSIRPGHESRSEFYGHVNVLGPSEMQRPLSVGSDLANSPEAYPFPMILFQRGAKQLGATVGYAHWDGATGQRPTTFLMDLALQTIHFTEVLQFGRLHTEEWYRALNAGLRLTGIAGSDFPANIGRFSPWPRTIPLLGPERTLVKAKAGESAYESWAAGVQRGDAVVSNGPLLELTVNGKPPGTVISWTGAGTKAEGVAKAYFYRPIEKVEIVVNGKVAASRAGDGKQKELTLPFQVELKESSWIAARATSAKLEHEPEIVAHTNAAYLHRDGVPTHVKADRETLARRWEKHMEWYRNAGLVFRQESQRRELFEKLEAALAVLREAPTPWQAAR